MRLKIDVRKKIFLPIVIILMIGFVVLDQVVKKIALSLLSVSAYNLNDYLSLEISRNYGIAFGLHVGTGIFYFTVIVFFVWLASGKLLNFKEMGKREILAVCFILSGAIGNLIDRVRFGYIIDFINFKDIVIFNLADVFIMMGVAILINIFFEKNLQSGTFLKNINKSKK